MNCCPKYGFDMSDQMRRFYHCYHCAGCYAPRPRLEMPTVDPFELARELAKKRSQSVTEVAYG